ncbi:hypothetical protein QUA27_21115 [Microcoleus sp. Pol14C6]|uniref:hypothetical protein n=1 Tax=unclassified Microcoleus TaxID=2642155 RepID=UPI002FD26C28
MLRSKHQSASAGLLSLQVEVGSPMWKGFLNLQTYQKIDSIKMSLSNIASF